eukprot:g2998.t1
MKFMPMVLAAIMLLAVTACQTDLVSESEYPRFERVADGEDFPISVPQTYDATRGWLVVKEDRRSAHSSEIRLPVAIIHSQAETKASPIAYLSGGPGTSAMKTAAFPGAYPWLKDRDFIVFGQRGTHFAKPALMCPEYREVVMAGNDQIAAVTACRARLKQAGIDLQNYNTMASADDLEDLRSVLGLETWSLYAGSYGTRLALIYAKSYGDRLESMVLDSPLPPNVMYDDESAVNVENALRAIAADCASDAGCAAAFPELGARFFQTINEAIAAPLLIDGIAQTLTAPDLVSLVPLSSEFAIRNAPNRMDRVAKLDPTLLAELNASAQGSDFAWGMRFSVWCSEALPFSDRSRSDAPKPVLGGYESAAIDPRICEAVHAILQTIEWAIIDRPIATVFAAVDPVLEPVEAVFKAIKTAMAALSGCAGTTPAVETPQWEQIFDGASLTGWTPKITGQALGEDAAGLFSVEDGALTVSYPEGAVFNGAFGHLFFAEALSDYRLRLEYRFTGEQIENGPGWAYMNSGVMVHAQAPETMGVGQGFPISVEAQFLGTGPRAPDRTTANICTPGTHIVIDDALVTQHCINSQTAAAPAGEWVSFEIEVRGGEIIQLFIAGEAAFTLTDPTFDTDDGDVARLGYSGPVELDDFTDPRAGDFAKSHPPERVGDRFALRVKHAWFQANMDNRFHGNRAPLVESRSV